MSVQLDILRLKTLGIQNFKSIQHAEIEDPGDFAIFIGRNDSGKSNLLDVLYFLKQASAHLQGAVAARGGRLRELILWKGDLEARLSFAFEIAPERRRELLEEILPPDAGIGVNLALASPFLKVLNYCLTIGRDAFKEELTTGHLVAGGNDVAIVAAKGNLTSCQVFLPDGGLRKAGRSLWRNQGNTISLTPVGGFGPSCVGLQAVKRQDIQEASLRLLTQWISDEIAGIEWISPIRRSQSSLNLAEFSELDSEASNLAGVLHTLYVNDRDKFQAILREAQRIAPSLADIIPRVAGALTVPSLHHKGEPQEVSYSFDQSSFGLRTALAIITKVLCAKPGGWVCIEEPETHLHPQAQAVLYDFLQRQAREKRIFISTHSSVFASLAPIENVWLVKRSADEPRTTEIQRVQPDNVDKVIQELGIRPSYNFEADAIVFIEDKLGPPVYDVWAKKEGIGDRVQFIGVEGWTNMDYFANAKIIGSRRIETKVFVIFDGDTGRGEKNKKVKARLIKELRIPPHHIFTLGQSELEGYLLDPHAIVSAFPELPRALSEEKLQEYLAGWQQRRDQKRGLEELFRRHSLGGFTTEKAVRIACAMVTSPPDLVEILERIKVGLDEAGSAGTGQPTRESNTRN